MSLATNVTLIWICTCLALVSFGELQSSITSEIQIINKIWDVDERFLSVTLDAGVLKSKAWIKFNTSSPVLLALSKELAPAYLRFGGNAENQLVFKDTTISPDDLLSREEIIFMSEADWDKLNEYATSVGYRLVFGLNAMLRKTPYDPWNTSNAILLLNYNSEREYSLDWELGNEINSHDKIYPLEGDRLGLDFVTLRALTGRFEVTKNSRLFGPDISTHSNRAFDFLSKFLQYASPVLDAVTFHQYYMDGKVAVDADFYNSTILDSLVPLIEKIQETVSGKKPLYLGETSSTYGGGTKGLSNAYAAGFMWLDKLGVSAVHGLKVVMRQSLFKGEYSLLDEDFFPNADYWLSVLYKRLVGKQVLQIVQEPGDPNIRIYAHCTRTGGKYQQTGGVTLFGMNLYKENISLVIKNMTNGPLHVYRLHPHGSHGLRARSVELNEKKLEMEGASLPPLEPLKQAFIGQSIVWLPLSLNFLVFPEAALHFCS